MRITKSTISINDIEVYARHGVQAQEYKIGNDFLVSVKLDYDATCAELYDDYNQAVDYAQVISIVNDVMLEPSRLIEHAAQRIADALVAAFPKVTAGSVTVSKIHPPISTPIGSASFTLHFSLT